MFFKIEDAQGDVGYVNISLVEFARVDLDGAITLYFIHGKPMKLEARNSKDILAYLKATKLNNMT